MIITKDGILICFVDSMSEEYLEILKKRLREIKLTEGLGGNGSSDGRVTRNGTV